MPQVEVMRRGRVEIFVMTRPERDNRISQQMAEEICAEMERARQDSEVVAAVITGHGDVFCLGGDYQGAGPSLAGRLEFARAYIDLSQAVARFGKPVIAAVNGNAHAGGFALLTACDMAIAAEGTTYGLPEAAKGLFPFLALALVRDQLPKKVLFDIVYQARLMDAEEAKSLHLINEILPRSAVLDRAVQIAETAGAYNPRIVGLGRDLYYHMRNVGPLEALEQSRFALAGALGAEDEARGG
jgi:enoyl-CoA hydratase/carnithine racemase